MDKGPLMRSCIGVSGSKPLNKWMTYKGIGWRG